MSWKLREIVVAAVLSVVCGAIYLGWDFLFQVVHAASPVAQAAFNGLWWIASGLVAYIVRKPGAALLAELVGAFAEFALGSPYGMAAVFIGLFQGLGAEIPFLATRYQKWGITTMMLSGAVGGIGNTFYSYYWQGVNQYSVGNMIGWLVVSMISGAILAGVLPKLIGDALKRTGVLRNFKIAGRE
ncbi:MAG: ABC-type thiamin-related transport system, permease component 1 [Bacilli bacterium]|nr:ABC-type thiamin-related transport system, permease component 1 [Bacilli bacterium]